MVSNARFRLGFALLLAACAAGVALPARPACAAATRLRDLVAAAPAISEIVNKKEFDFAYPEGAAPWKELEVFLVVRQVDENRDPKRKGWVDYQIIGRAALAQNLPTSAHFVLYKPFQGALPEKGDKLVRTGDPLTLDEMDLLRKEVLGVLNRDKELEDLYTGLISFKLGNYAAKLSTTSNGDTNAFKQADFFYLLNFGVKWWFFFNPAVGLNFEMATGSIPTKGFHREDETSSQTYINPGLLYRGRLLIAPAIYSVTYFINSFKTSNPDDFLISSTYSGVNLGVTLYFPYRTELLRLGRFTFSFNNFEVGGGLAPAVQVSDAVFKRGEKSSGLMFSGNAGLEFNFSYRPWRFTNDIFLVFEGGLQRYSFSFSGATQGTLPGGAAIPEGSVNTELQTWFGVRLKYNMKDYIGELISDL